MQNDEDVKVVVGKNLDQIVLDESKDVLLEVCSCRSLRTWNLLIVCNTTSFGCRYMHHGVGIVRH
jgi:hypothetical protein